MYRNGETEEQLLQGVEKMDQSQVYYLGTFEFTSLTYKL
jgi:hypothetical protein